MSESARFIYDEVRKVSGYMKSKRRGILRLEGSLLLVGVLLLSVCVYFLATMNERVRATDKIEKKDYSQEYYRFADLMAEVYLEIRDKYVEEVDPQKLFDGAINGMFSALDPHSAYLGADNFKELEKSTEGEFSGVGIHIEVRDGVLTVVSPIPGTPAAKAGVRPWDRIIEIEGKSTENMTATDAVKTLTGPIGSKVNIVIFRESERKQIPLTIVRDRIKIESIYSNSDSADYVTPYYKYLLKNKIGYARITKFSEQASEDLGKALGRMKDAGVNGLILDVRYDTGGLLDQAISVSNLFLDKGQVIVATKGRLADQNHVYKAENPKMVDWPIILLVNHGSASASEILAGALKDHNRAVLVGPKGTNTYGKGSVQTIMPLRVSLEKDKSGNDLPNAIRLTTAKYYTPDNIGPDGKSIHGIGIAPDVSVEVTPKQEAKLLIDGLLLGDPSRKKPGDKETKDKADKSADDKEKDSSEGVENEEGEMELPAPLEQKDDTKTKDEKKPAPTGPAIDKNGDPFYMKKKNKDNAPTTDDVQLKYGVDLLKALLITGHAK